MQVEEVVFPRESRRDFNTEYTDDVGQDSSHGITKMIHSSKSTRLGFFFVHIIIGSSSGRTTRWFYTT